MKRAFSVFAALLLLIAAGCEKQSISKDAPPPVPTSFTANIKAVYGDTEMTALFTQKSADSFEIQMLSPEILKPLALSYASDICTVTYDGLKFETDLTRFPQTAFGALLTQSLTDTAQGIDVQKTYADGIWTYTGTGERGVFVLTRNAETGAWLELEIEGAQLHVVFSDFVIK